MGVPQESFNPWLSALGRPPGHASGSGVVRRVLAAIFAAAISSGFACQEQTTLPLPALAADQASDSSRAALADRCQDLPDRQALIVAMVDAVNAERARHNLPPLRPQATLMRIADFYGCRLVEGDFFSHQDPFDKSTVDSRAAHFGYAFLKIGENLAAGQQSVQQALDDWMASAGHRANILDPAFTEMGVAVKTGGPFGPYWVQEFGRPISEPSGQAPAARDPASSRPDDDDRPTTRPSADKPTDRRD